MLNTICVAGRIVRDIELRRFGDGTPVTSFTIACERDYKDKNNKRETDFIDVVAFKKTAEFVNQYFSKGRMAVVSGRLQIRTWTDKEGNNRRSAEIVADNVYFGDSKQDGQRAATPAGGVAVAPMAAAGVTVVPPQFAELEDNDDQLPF